MSDADESSYYEIALTNRQVLGGFVILLTCMLVAFFSGVWVGRGGAASVPSTTSEVADTADAADAGLESFRFFEQEDAPKLEEVTDGEPGAAATAGDPGTTLAEDVGAAPPPAAGPDQDGIDAQPAAPSRSAPPPPPPSRPPPRREPPVIAETPTEDAAVPRTTARRLDEDPADGELFVQVFSSHDEVQARKVLRQLLDGRLKAFLSPADVGNKAAYRVRIGPFDSREEAEKVARQVRQAYKLDTWITSS